jgi:predicted RNA binding protein YcfA (HicA-like mRNA interferase family)
MKRRDLIKKIEDGGAVFIRHGGKHDWYQNPETKMSQPVPRHTEINEMLAKNILKKLGRTGKG